MCQVSRPTPDCTRKWAVNYWAKYSGVTPVARWPPVSASYWVTCTLAVTVWPTTSPTRSWLWTLTWGSTWPQPSCQPPAMSWCRQVVQIFMVDKRLLKNFWLLSSSGPGHLQVSSKTLKSQGLSQISERPGPGACSYNCNVSTHHHHPWNFSEQKNIEISSYMNW